MKKTHTKIISIALNIVLGFFLVISSLGPVAVETAHGVVATVSDVVVTPYTTSVRITGKITAAGYDKPTLTVYVGEELTPQVPPNEIGESFFTTVGTGGKDNFEIGITGLQAGHPYHFYMGDGMTPKFAGSSGSFTLKGATSGTGSDENTLDGVVTNLKAAVSSDGKYATVTGNVTTNGYDPKSLVVEYGTGTSFDRSSPVMILSSESNKTDKFTATIPNLATAKTTYKIRLADDYTVSFPGSTGSFTTSGSSSPTDQQDADGKITNLKAVPGADGKSVVITGNVTFDSYDPASFVVKYGTGFTQGSQAPVVITASDHVTDSFVVRINDIPAGTYNYGFSDKDTDSFDGGTDTFVISGTGGGGSTLPGGDNPPGDGDTIGGGSGTFTPVATFVGKINRYILNPLIVLLFAAALVYFLFGVFQFVLHLDDSGEREIGKSHMVWGIIGIFIMFAVFTILNLIQKSLGVSLNPNIPVR